MRSVHRTTAVLLWLGLTSSIGLSQGLPSDVEQQLGLRPGQAIPSDLEQRGVRPGAPLPSDVEQQLRRQRYRQQQSRYEDDEDDDFLDRRDSRSRVTRPLPSDVEQQMRRRRGSNYDDDYRRGRDGPRYGER
jgi:hypothetical protein